MQNFSSLILKLMEVFEVTDGHTPWHMDIVKLINFSTHSLASLAHCFLSPDGQLRKTLTP